MASGEAAYGRREAGWGVKGFFISNTLYFQCDGLWKKCSCRNIVDINVRTKVGQVYILIGTKERFLLGFAQAENQGEHAAGE